MSVTNIKAAYLGQFFDDPEGKRWVCIEINPDKWVRILTKTEQLHEDVAEIKAMLATLVDIIQNQIRR